MAELDTRLVAARAALSMGRLEAGRRQLAHAAAANRSGPLELRVRAWYAHALLRKASNDHRGMESALRAGIALGADGRDVLLGLAGGEAVEDATSAQAVTVRQRIIARSACT